MSDAESYADPVALGAVMLGATVSRVEHSQHPDYAVGGKVFDAVLPLLNTKARVPVCGLISQYNATALPDGPDRLSLLTRTILTKRLKVQGFIIFDDYGARYPEFYQEMSDWLAAGKIKTREQIVQGLEQAPEAFIGLLTGKNIGKLVIQLADA